MRGLPRAFWILWAGMLVNRAGAFVSPFLALYLVNERHTSVERAGTVVALVGFGSLGSGPISGALADRIGRRPTLVLSTGLGATAMFALGFSRTELATGAAALALGFFGEMYRAPAMAMVSDLVPAELRTRAFGLIYWAVNLGFSVAMVLGGTLARAGFTPLFWADAVTCAMFGILIWRAVPETLPAAPDASGESDGGFATVLRDPLFVAFLLLALVAECVYMQAYTTLPLAMTGSGLPAQAYGLAMAVNGIVIVAVQPVTAAWLGRRDKTTMIAGGVGLFGLGFGLTALATTTWEYALCVAIWTLGEILTNATAVALIAGLAPPRLRGRYNGVFGLAFSVGYLIAPLAGTRLLAHGQPVLWLSCAGACAVAAAGQLGLGPAIGRREGAAEAGATDRSV